MRDRAHERVEPLLRREPRDREHGDVVGPRPASARSASRRGEQPVGRRAELRRRRSCPRTARSAPGRRRGRASTRARACRRRAPRAAPRRIGGTTAPLTARRQPGRASRSFDSTSRTYGTPRARHHATAACEANVLQPETTTTSGSRVGERAEDAERDRVVVAERPVEAGHAPSLEEDGAVPRLDRPRPALHGAPRVEHREVELRPRRDAVEHHGAERRRLGETSVTRTGSSAPRAEPRSRRRRAPERAALRARSRARTACRPRPDRARAPVAGERTARSRGRRLRAGRAPSAAARRASSPPCASLERVDELAQARRPPAGARSGSSGQARARRARRARRGRPPGRERRASICAERDLPLALALQLATAVADACASCLR